MTTYLAPFDANGHLERMPRGTSHWLPADPFYAELTFWDMGGTGQRYAILINRKTGVRYPLSLGMYTHWAVLLSANLDDPNSPTRHGREAAIYTHSPSGYLRTTNVPEPVPVECPLPPFMWRLSWTAWWDIGRSGRAYTIRCLGTMITR